MLPVKSSGLLYQPIAYKVKEEDGRVDYDEMERLAVAEKPKLIIGGASSLFHATGLCPYACHCDKVGALLMIDMLICRIDRSRSAPKSCLNMHTLLLQQT